MIVCGIGGNVAQRTILETGQFFGWIGACAGINVALFIGVLAVFALNIINDKILNNNHRKFRPGSRMWASKTFFMTSYKSFVSLCFSNLNTYQRKVSLLYL